jgi:hypothetical protein
MNKAFTIVALFASILLLSNKGGYNGSSTGASFESNSGCADCHFGGTFDSLSINLNLRDSANNIVAAYVPGVSYTVEVLVKGKGAAYFGFQTVSTDFSNAQAGTVGTLGTNVRRGTYGAKTYVFQSSPRVDGKFTYKWTAPSTDSMKFNLAGIAANGNNGSNGDRAIRNQVTIKKQLLNKTSNILLERSLLLSNLIYDKIQFSEENVSATLISLNGSQIKLKENYDVSNFQNGMYILKYTFENKVKSEKVVILH